MHYPMIREHRATRNGGRACSVAGRGRGTFLEVCDRPDGADEAPDDGPPRDVWRPPRLTSAPAACTIRDRNIRQGVNPLAA